MTNYLRTAIAAALEAGVEIMDVYGQEFQVDLKEDDSPLTQADMRANARINDHLHKLDIPIISEENKQLPYTERSTWDRCWIVDPLDGTKEFIKRNGEFTVNIALVENGVPLLGVIYVPVEGTLYFNDLGEPAYKLAVIDHELNDKSMEARELLRPASDSDTIRVVGSRSHLNEATEAFVESLKVNGQSVEIVSRGSSLKFCLVAEGKADLYPRYAPTMEWDTAAGQAICQAAGVEVIDRETENPMSYNKENLLNPHFLVRRND